MGAPVENPISPAKLDQSISEVLERPEFSWRMPREAAVGSAEPKGLLATLLSSVRETVEVWAQKIATSVRRFIDWIRDWFGSRKSLELGGASGWLDSLHGLLWLVLAILVSILTLLIWRVWFRRKATSFAADEVRPAVPNLAEENVTANQLPEDGWLTLGRDLLARGELRLALRAFYLASLAHLADRGLISIARFKSNQDYERELGRRAHSLPEIQQLFSSNVSLFDRIWYGRYSADEATLSDFVQNFERMKAC